MKKEHNIDNIHVVTARESVRLRPQHYFDTCFEEKKLDSLVFESLCHAFDEYYDGKCDQISLTIWKDAFKVRYNAGMPLGEAKAHRLPFPVEIMTQIFACSNLKKHLSVGEEYCHIGVSQINFGSESIELTTVSENQKGVFTFKQGEHESTKMEDFEENESWTEIHVHPSKELFGNLEITFDGVTEKMKEIEQKLTGLKFDLISHIK